MLKLIEIESTKSIDPWKGREERMEHAGKGRDEERKWKWKKRR